MPITEKQIERRQNYIGSSDIAAILGLSPLRIDGRPYKTAIDVWHEKVFPLEKSETTDAQKRGLYLEDGLIRFAEDQTGLKFVRNQFRAKPPFGANCDAIAKDQPIGCECKSTSEWKGWGDKGTDQVPDYVSTQCHHQMYCGDLEKVYVSVLLPAFGRLDMRIYEIQRSEKIIDDMVELGTTWWNIYVIPKTQPPHKAPANIEILKRIQRQPQSVIEYPADKMDIMDEWAAAKDQECFWKKEREARIAKILELLGDAEGANLPTGGIFTYLQQKGADNINLKLLREQYPDVYKEVVSPNIYRVPRIKGGSNV